MRTRLYNQETHEPDDEISKAWAWKIRNRFELCVGWFVGPMPTFTYFNPAGRLHPGAVALTLRVWRVMVGWRFYRKGAKE